MKIKYFKATKSLKETSKRTNIMAIVKQQKEIETVLILLPLTKVLCNKAKDNSMAKQVVMNKKLRANGRMINYQDMESILKMAFLFTRAFTKMD